MICIMIFINFRQTLKKKFSQSVIHLFSLCVCFIFFIEQKSLILVEVDLSFLITYLVLLASCLRNSFQLQYH